MRVEPDGTVSYIERFDALMTSTFHLKSFPFDAQKLEIIVHPFTDQQESIAFVPNQLPVWTATDFSSYASLESWKFESLTFEFGTGASQYGATRGRRGQVRDQGRAPLWVLSVEGVSAAAVDGGRVVVGLLVRSVRGLEPGNDSGNDDPDDHRVRARNLIDPPAGAVSDFRRRFFSHLLHLHLRDDSQVTAVHITIAASGARQRQRSAAPRVGWCRPRSSSSIRS